MSVASREAERASIAGAVVVLPRPPAQRLAVLSTKLEPPYQRPGIIARSRLVARLAAAPTPMVAVIAPAGYGKSTALSQLGDVAGRQIAWLSADARDGDPATLIRHIAAAIDRVTPLPPETDRARRDAGFLGLADGRAASRGGAQGRRGRHARHRRHRPDP